MTTIKVSKQKISIQKERERERSVRCWFNECHLAKINYHTRISHSFECVCVYIYIDRERERD